MEKPLSDRKKKILKALVDSYIDTAEPVSSGEIRERYMPDVSGATIRNELSALEEMGFITQPHTSAGRIPLPTAYKIYVGDLLSENTVSASEINIIEREFAYRLSEIEEITKRTAKLISDTTNYTSFVVMKGLKVLTIKEIKLVEIGFDSALAIVITDAGVFRDKTIELPEGVRGEQIAAANKVLNNIFAGKSLESLSAIAETLPEALEFELQDYRDLFDRVLNLIKSYVKTGDSVFVEGALKMLDYPEYSRAEDAKRFLEVVSDKDTVRALALGRDDIEMSIKIGPEDGVDNCAVVAVKYMINGKEYGQAGVIGPERMDYKKVVSVLNYLGRGQQAPTERPPKR
ncbi:MAG: heat-inducible transcriptional repressor HrcA [Clostridiaceae bacterium]|jgi:heat-inducible transcriptional repressor|nr:heat-inducible transcriptional repressor HrcA [Clostridiaceae bacterium]